MIVGTQAEGAFSITLALGPRWPNVELARSMVCSCVTAAFGQSEYGDLVATVTSKKRSIISKFRALIMTLLGFFGHLFLMTFFY